MAQQTGGAAIRGTERRQFSGILLLLVWRMYKVFTVLGPVLKRIGTMANLREVVNYAKFQAESTGASPTLQLKHVVEKITKNCWQRSLQKSS